jgi:hypothetical protein
MRHLTGACLLIALVGTVPAQAEITITRAEYAGGVLVVQGETSQPNQRVVLDGHYDTRTDRNKRFRFRIPYLPADCTVSIRAGQQTRPASVANCDAGVRSPGAAGNTDRSAGPTEAGAQMRVVRQSCAENEECRVLCREGEFAINAFCQGGEAKLLNERTVGCGPPAGSRIVAYCLAPASPETR